MPDRLTQHSGYQLSDEELFQAPAAGLPSPETTVPDSWREPSMSVETEGDDGSSPRSLPPVHIPPRCSVLRYVFVV